MKSTVKTINKTHTLKLPDDVTYRLSCICRDHDMEMADFIAGALMSAITVFERHTPKKRRTTKKAPAKKVAAKKATAKKVVRKKVTAKKVVAKKKAPAKRKAK